MLIKVTPDIEKCRSILKMIDITLEMINEINISKYSSNVVKEYYNIIREAMSIILLIDGYKTYGEYAHKDLIDFLKLNYKQFVDFEINLINNLRIIRNKISYDGFFVKKDFIFENQAHIQKIINKLRKLINQKIK